MARPGRSRVAAAALLVALIAPGRPISTATIVVDDTCSLSDAIRSANFDTATGGCPAGSGDDTIELTADVALTEPLPDAEPPVTIDGKGFAVSRAAPIEFSVFRFEGNGRAALRNVTVSNGSAIAGGGIHNNELTAGPPPTPHTS